MTGKVIKTLTRGRYRRSADTPHQNKNGALDPECDRPECIEHKSENEPSEAYVGMLEEFGERAAIREFDGGQSRVKAELETIDEIFPWLRTGNELVIPFNTPKRYQWWNGGQPIEVTLWELGVSEETISRYVFNKAINCPDIAKNEEMLS